MGKVQAPEEARVVIAVLFREQSVLHQARESLAAVLGPIRKVGPEIDFDWTDYYKREMGPGLKRCFLVCERLAPRETLADLKRLAKRIEADLAADGGNRRVNLDPGLLTLENFVLATTKNQPQRIYLRDGIYAEVTLWYANGSFTPLERTYQDYRSVEVRGFLARLRDEYKQALRARAASIDADALAAAIGG